ncbi:hypothetical protein ACWFRF_21365 [Nocardia sp. NPDC055165]
MSRVSAKVDVLNKASMSWRYDVTGELRFAAEHIESLKYSMLQFGLFAGAWKSYSTAAAYIQTRLLEGKGEATAMGEALRQVAEEFGAQDEDTAKKLDTISQGLDLPPQ